jgi:hypothetical protein
VSKRQGTRPAPGSDAERAARNERRARDDQLTAATRAGDGEAFRRLVDSWLDAAYDRVARRGISTEMAGSVLTRTFRVTRREIDEGEAGTFGAFVARAAADQAGGPRQPADELSPPQNRHAFERLTRGTDPEALADDEAVAAVLWEAASVFGEQGSDVLDLHWRYGLDSDEIETVLGLTPGEADDMIAKMPRGFAAAVRTRLLWGDGSPEHDVLVAELRKQGATSFDAQTVRIINRHIRECAVCRARSLVALPAVEIFAAISMESAPTTLRKEVVVATTVATTGTAAAAAAAAAGVVAPEREAEPEAAEAGKGAVLTGSAAALGATAAAAAVGGNDTSTLEPGTFEPGTFEPGGPDSGDSSETTPLSPAAHDRSVSPLTGVTIPATAAALAGDTATTRAHEPVSGRHAEEADGSSKRWLAAGIAAAVLIIAGIAFAATRGGDDGGVDTASGDVITTTTTTTPSSTTTTPAESTDTTVPDATPEETTPTTVDAAPVTTPGLPIPPPTEPVTTTTAALDLRVEFAIVPNQKSTSYPQDNAARIQWNVTSGRPVTVTVSGTGFDTTVSNTGDSAVCPTGWGSFQCNSEPGVYYYRLVVEENGQIWRDEVRQLTIR